MTNEQITATREALRKLIQSHGQPCSSDKCVFITDGHNVMAMLDREQVSVSPDQALKAEVVDLRNKLAKLEQEFREVAAQSERFRQAAVASNNEQSRAADQLDKLESGFAAVRQALGCDPQVDADIVAQAAVHIAEKYTRMKEFIPAELVIDRGPLTDADARRGREVSAGLGLGKE